MASRYDHDFKLSTVRLIQSGERTAVQAAADLGVSANCVRKWVRDLGDKPADSLPGEDTLAELKRLRAEVQVLRTEREILKKAATFFAKEQP